MTWFERAAAGSAAGELALATDWAATSVGDPDTWDPAVRAAVTLCLGTRFPTLVAWGPELSMLYNDGYALMLGSMRHPGAMGSPVERVWADLWPDVGPLMHRVVEDREVIWLEHQPFVTTRSGYPEETSFTFCYSPIVAEDGSVLGVLDLSVESTDLVTANRRLATLGTLSASLHEVGLDLAGTFARAKEVLGAAPNIPRADAYLLEGCTPVLAMTTGDGSPGPDLDVLRHVAVAGEGARVGDVTLEPVPTGSRGTTPTGTVAVWRNPLRPEDESQRSFVRLTARTLAQAIGRAVDHSRQVAELREVSVALQLAILSPEASDVRWHTRYLPAEAGLAVGGDWYDVVDLGGGRHGLVVGDCVGHGLHAAAIMGQLRSAARALLLQGLAPHSVLDGLDRFAAVLPGAEAATVLCVVVEPDGTLTYAAAGHPWPLVVGAQRAQWLRDGRGAPLTYADTPRTSARASLAPGECLVLYTDGLIERRDESLSVGLERLRTAAVEAVSTPSGAMLADRLLAALLPYGGQRDDVAIVVFGDAAAQVTSASGGAGVPVLSPA